jgi:NADH-quinone oxidoreductase subunit J
MEYVIFGITALVSIACAVAMLLSSNAVHSALFLVLNFTSVAVLYILLQAPFLAMIQITVYAGAIMVLFLFVIMLLGAERAEAEQNRLAWQQPLALILGAALLVEAAIVIWNGRAITMAAPPATNAEVGAPRAIAEALFTDYLLPFEMTSFLLLVALIGSVVLTLKSRAKTDAGSRGQSAGGSRQYALSSEQPTGGSRQYETR